MPGTATISLDQITIASPCTASWDDMPGDEKRRFCAQCGLHVHNLSAMTADEAGAFISAHAGFDGAEPERHCARLFRRSDGTVLTRDCPVGLALARERVRRFGTAVVALLGLTTAWGWLTSIPAVARVRDTEPYVTLRNAVWGKPIAPVPPPVPIGGFLMGAIACPAPPPAPAPAPVPTKKPEHVNAGGTTTPVVANKKKRTTTSKPSN